METNNPIKYGFFAQVFILFGVYVLLLMLLALIFGDGAKDVSTLFSFASDGLAITTLLQFLLNSILLTFLKTIFFSHKVFKNMMALWRTILLLLSILITTILFVAIFDWFSFDNLYGWVGFFLCFGGCFLISFLFMIIKTRLDNKKYNELLSNYKNIHGGEHDES